MRGAIYLLLKLILIATRTNKQVKRQRHYFANASRGYQEPTFTLTRNLGLTLNNIHGQTAACGFFVFGFHV